MAYEDGFIFGGSSESLPVLQDKVQVEIGAFSPLVLVMKDILAELKLHTQYYKIITDYPIVDEGNEL